MKGQYYQVESILTLGLSLTLAVALISVSGFISDRLTTDVKTAQANIILSNIDSGLKSVKNSDFDYSSVNLSSGSRNSQLDFVARTDSGQLILDSPSLNQSLPSTGYSGVEGQISSNNINIEKNQSLIRIRDLRVIS